jgi:hypothetical protein
MLPNSNDHPSSNHCCTHPWWKLSSANFTVRTIVSYSDEMRSNLCFFAVSTLARFES